MMPQVFVDRLEKEREENLRHARSMAESYRLAAKGDDDEENLEAAAWWENRIKELSKKRRIA